MLQYRVQNLHEVTSGLSKKLHSGHKYLGLHSYGVVLLLSVLEQKSYQNLAMLNLREPFSSSHSKMCYTLRQS